MNFSEITNIKIPEGVVSKITTLDGIVLWVKKGVEPDIPDLPEPLANEIYYTSIDGKIVTPYKIPTDNTIISNTYENGIGKIVFEKDLTEIVSDMFNTCKTLQTITLPNSVTTFQNYVFVSCTSLEQVNIPESVTSIGMSVFNKCTALQNIVIPDSVTSLGESVFYGCTSLKNVTLPEYLTTIKYGTFQNCSSLNTITIPKNITILENKVFADCVNLRNVLSYPLRAPQVEEYTFANTGKAPNKIIKVKEGASGYCDGDWYDYVLDKYGWGVEFTLE